MNISYNDFTISIKSSLSLSSTLVSVIDSANNNVIKNIPVREGALKIASNPMNDDMYVTNNVNNTVSVIKTTSSP